MPRVEKCIIMQNTVTLLHRAFGIEHDEFSATSAALLAEKLDKDFMIVCTRRRVPRVEKWMPRVEKCIMQNTVTLLHRAFGIEHDEFSATSAALLAEKLDKNFMIVCTRLQKSATGREMHYAEHCDTIAQRLQSGVWWC
jgi:hypothetical protein